ncbi:MAG: DUF1345 domain-containing protein [Actinobacteria bacterium]|nr:MAG: DUF1345 domain-containing protein [Actinomycetota bacterium]
MRLPRHPSERMRVIVAGSIGIIVAVATAFAAPWQLAVLTGWDASAVTLLAWIWTSIAPLSATETRAVATREDDSRAAALLLLLVACTVSLVGVILAFIEADVVHTVFTLRYAHVYFTNTPGGIDFPRESMPDYHDFAYVAFTVGMTFQVSDTNLTTKAMRRVVLRHALLSWLFGVVIVAMTINLVAGLVR